MVLSSHRVRKAPYHRTSETSPGVAERKDENGKNGLYEGEGPLLKAMIRRENPRIILQ